MRNSWKRLLALLCGVCMSVFAGFALASCKDPEEDSSSEQSSTEQAHEHSWDSGVVASTSTCTRQGETVFTCTTCGSKKVEYAPLASHDYVEVETVSPTCTNKGYTVSQCSVCFDEIRGEFTNATGHEYETSVQPATCTSHEITTYDCKHCDEDDYAEITAVTAGHSFANGVCTVCGEEYLTNPTDPLGHNYVATVVAPTCMDRGYTRYACTNAGCQDSYISNLVDKVDHVYEDNVVAPTCTEKGYTAHSCTFCGTTYRDTYTAATGHSFANGVCTVCGVDAPESY